MKITTKTIHNGVVVHLNIDNLDASNAKEFSLGMGPILNEHNSIILDMSSLEFVDSSGLGALLSCLRQQHASDGSLALCAISKPVRTLFELVRMHRVFDIYNTCDEAVLASADQHTTNPPALDATVTA